MNPPYKERVKFNLGTKGLREKYLLHFAKYLKSFGGKPKSQPDFFSIITNKNYYVRKWKLIRRPRNVPPTDMKQDLAPTHI